LLWPSSLDEPLPPLDALIRRDAREYLGLSAAALDWMGRATSQREKGSALETYQRVSLAPDSQEEAPEILEEGQVRDRVFGQLTNYGALNARLLGLDPGLSVAVSGFHAVQRLGSDQRVLVEFVVQFIQTHPATDENLGGLSLRAGTTVVFGVDGGARYVIAKPLPAAQISPNLNASAEERLQRIHKFVAQLDSNDPMLAFGDADYFRNRMKRRASIRHLHGGGT
jgi:hypothetical protein